MKIRAEYEVGKLENKVEVQANDAIKSIENLINSVNSLTNALDKSFNSTKKNKLKHNVDNSVSSIKALKKVMNFGAMYVGLKRIWNVATNISSSYIDMIETNNLFEVSMGKVIDEYGNLDEEASKYYIKALEFQDKMNEKLATNKAELMNYQAMYYSMFKSQGIDKNSSYLMSESLTKAGYDIASLYNLTVDDAMDKIKSGIAGQVEPLRKIGVDISESALTNVIKDAGITDRSVQQLSYAEKEVARYIAILNQAGQAQGDFANTFEQPANQIKVFKNQLEELKQIAGSFIVNTFGGIIVYANAIIMALKEILKSFATLFGYDLTTGGGNLSGYTEDVNDNLGSAVGKAKELKRQLMGFDEINNITPQNNSGSGSGTAVGIDDKLLKSLKEWDNKMESISGRAQEIRDKILDTLGFSKDIEGNLKWSWKDMNGIVKTVGIIVGIIAGISLIGKLVKTVQWLSKINTILKTGKGATTAFGTGLTTLNGIFGKTGKHSNELISPLGQVVLGLTGLVTTSIFAYNSMKDLSNETIETKEAILKLTGSIIGATTSGAIIGSVFGPAGTALGALTGLVVSGTSAFIGYNSKAIEFAKRIEGTQKSYKELTDTINESATAKLNEIDNIQGLSNELKTLVDANGKVKEGYEGRVSFILNELNEAFGTEYKLVDDTIEKYEELEQKITDLIITKRSEILLNAYEEKYREAIEKRGQAYLDLQEIEEDYITVKENCIYRISQLEKERTDTNSSIIDNQIKLYQDEIKAMEKNVNNQRELLDDYNTDIYNYETLNTAIVTNNKELQKAMYDEFTATVEKNGQKITLSGEQQIDALKIQTEKYIDIIKNKGDKVSKEENKMLNSVLNSLSTKLVEQTKTVEDLTPSNVEAWKTLAKGNYDIYKETLLDNVEPELSQAIQDATGTIIDMTPEVERITKKLSETVVDSLDSSQETRKKATEAIKEYMSGLSDEEQRKILKEIGIDNVDEVIKGLKQGDMSEDVGLNIIKGLQRGLANNYWQGRTLSTAYSFATKILNKFKNTFDEHSPSKKTKQFGIYLLKGLGIGINAEENNVLHSVKEFSSNLLNEMNTTFKGISNGILIDTKDMAVDANQYVNYSAIKGQIQTQGNITVSNNIIQGIAEAISESIKNTDINVNIEAKTDEGVIVKKASQGFKDYVMQTGELPFPLPT